ARSSEPSPECPSQRGVAARELSEPTEVASAIPESAVRTRSSRVAGRYRSSGRSNPFSFETPRQKPQVRGREARHQRSAERLACLEEAALAGMEPGIAK